MSNKEKAQLLEFLMWLSSYKRIQIDYIETITAYEQSKQMCKLLCPEKKE